MQIKTTVSFSPHTNQNQFSLVQSLSHVQLFENTGVGCHFLLSLSIYIYAHIRAYIYVYIKCQLNLQKAFAFSMKLHSHVITEYSEKTSQDLPLSCPNSVSESGEKSFLTFWLYDENTEFFHPLPNSWDDG